MGGDLVDNWAGNFTYAARALHEPESLDELRRLIAGATRLRALGTRHSFNAVADTTGDLVSVARLPRRLEIDPDRRTATVSAGLRYGEITPDLSARGWALPNLGSLPHISVAGATATGTHGSGVGNRVLAASVAQVELVTATGDVLCLSRAGDPQRFPGAVIALGRLGVVTALTLDLEPDYEVRQVVHLGLPAEAALEHLDTVLAGAHSVSLFTRWTEPLEFEVLSKYRTGTPSQSPALEAWGARPAPGPWHPVPGMPPENATDQLDAPGPWYARLPHFKLEFTPSSGEELQTEYFVDRRDARAAIEAVFGVRSVVTPVLQISEVRGIAPDDMWLSPAYGRDTVALHFTWVHDIEVALPAVRAVEEVLAPLRPRPHWGKVFTMTPEAVRPLYERLPDAVRLAAELDPKGMFRNDFVERYLDG